MIVLLYILAITAFVVVLLCGLANTAAVWEARQSMRFLDEDLPAFVSDIHDMAIKVRVVEDSVDRLEGRAAVMEKAITQFLDGHKAWGIVLSHQMPLILQRLVKECENCCAEQERPSDD